MTDRPREHKATRLLFIMAALVIIAWGISQAQALIVLILVACFLAILGTVPVIWMERKKVPSVAAVLIVMTTMVVFLLSVGAIVGASLSNFSNALPFYQSRLHDALLNFKTFMASKGFAVTDRVLLGYLNPAAIMNLTAQLFTTLSSVLSNTVLILFTVLFILLEAATFPAKLRSALDDPQADFPQFKLFVDDIKRYMIIKTLLNLSGGVLIAIWLTILGVDYPVLWGFLAFLLHFIPSIGSVIAAVPTVTFAYIQLGGGSAALTAVGFVVIGNVLGNVLEPKIVGRNLRMSTLVIFLSLIFWGYLLGIVGALLCVPLTMTVKLACELSNETRWIAVLLGPAISTESDKHPTL